MPLTVNATLAGDLLPAGRTAVVSQSGSMLGTLLSRGQARGLRFSRMISVGNEADLGVGEITELLIADPHTDVVLLFLETLRDAPRLAAAARAAHAAGKAIVAYKLGRSSLGAALAVSHTGAIAGEDAAYDAFFRAHGILRVEIATGKAYGSLGMRLPSRNLMARAESMPRLFDALAAVSDGRMVPVPGGVLIRRGDDVVGAVGVSGDTSDRDEDCAVVGITASGLTADVESTEPR
jgi:uncharacterized protein GlcG (DUF336 family)